MPNKSMTAAIVIRDHYSGHYSTTSPEASFASWKAPEAWPTPVALRLFSTPFPPFAARLTVYRCRRALSRTQDLCVNLLSSANIRYKRNLGGILSKEYSGSRLEPATMMRSASYISEASSDIRERQCSKFVIIRQGLECAFDTSNIPLSLPGPYLSAASGTRDWQQGL